ncbi:RNA polymerase sigma factor [Alteromonas stellipolaris]|uniref:RNA polymerase sigma factor n=1 Tax=Alteromonas stellipolaris TaxID=233316 RepID=UPI0026E2E444|nr:sigma-70 family RNA polymerase sigma factor [Alteromonas stellipolaris]MDO6534089.1 sigma-70 family RNA polymerase sigma factor [Alteromonas stellipolaris]MDO6626017.1 sigma-70 family RNA polymerase sigma factor [Alteromonas stellipolaris]MDP2597085.1 sigma-70 family RNA polymerase sigma factor [Alteromonas stellipolaris]
MDVYSSDVIAAQSGDLKAFERLINASKNTVTAIALGIVRDIDASEDVAQKVFINCWQNLASLTNPKSFMPWVRQVARYMAINYLRDNKVSQSIKGDEGESILASFCKSDDTLETRVSDEQTKKIVAALIDELPSDSREVVLLYYREQCSTKHVAQLLNISDAAVRQKLSRARAMLKTLTLDKFSRVIIATTPAVTFTSMTLSLLANTKPAAAAVTAGATGSASKSGVLTSVWSKVIWVLSGAMFGALVAMMAVIASHKLAERYMQHESDKKKLKQVRNYTLVWIFVWGVLFAASYEFSTGFIAPLLTYCGFGAGIAILTKRAHQIIYSPSQKLNSPPSDTEFSLYEQHEQHAQLGEEKSTDVQVKQPVKVANVLGLYGGLILGFVGLIAGLINSGRLVIG